MDAVFKISDNAACAIGRGNYAMSGDKPEASKRLLTDSYSLYRVNGAPAECDGKVLNVTSSVGAQSGSSIVYQL